MLCYIKNSKPKYIKLDDNLKPFFKHINGYSECEFKLINCDKYYIEDVKIPEHIFNYKLVFFEKTGTFGLVRTHTIVGKSISNTSYILKIKNPIKLNDIIVFKCKGSFDRKGDVNYTCLYDDFVLEITVFKNHDKGLIKIATGKEHILGFNIDKNISTYEINKIN